MSNKSKTDKRNENLKQTEWDKRIRNHFLDTF